MKKIKVLIYVKPSNIVNERLPILQPLLQTYYNDFGDNPDQVEWLVSVDFQTQEEIEAYVKREQPDIIGLSLYVWNIDQSLEEAERFRAIAPNALIIAGGPGVTLIKDDAPFTRYPFLDVLSNPLAFGEWFFLDLLNNLTNTGKPNWPSVQSAIYPAKGDRAIVFQSSKHRDSREFTFTKTSIYALPWYQEHVRKIRERYPNEELWVLFESDRGCPYACSFCEWGIGDRKKLIKKDKALIESEIRDLARIKPDVINIINSNFGILNRDNDILVMMGELINRKVDKKPVVWFSGLSKTNKKNLFQIYETLREYEFSKTIYKVSVQDFDEDVKLLNDRTDVPIGEMFGLAKQIKKELGFPYLAERIIGLPGKTLASAYNDYDLVLEHLDRELRPGNVFVLLKGTPAAEPAFMARHGINTNFEVAEFFNTSSFITPDEFYSKVHIASAVCETATYTRKEFVQMLFLENLAIALFNKGHLRYFFHYAKRHVSSFTVSQFLRFFCEQLYEYDVPFTQVLRGAREFAEHRITVDARVDTLVPIELPEGTRFTYIYSLINFAIVSHKPEFIAYVKYILGLMNIQIDDDTLDFFTLRTLDAQYDPRQGRVLTFNGSTYVTNTEVYGNYNKRIHTHLDPGALRWLGADFKEDNLLRFTRV